MSLNPQVDRLCMVCEARVADDGEILSYRFHEGVMHSAARLTYNKMAQIVLERDKALRQEYAAMVTH
ncbi:MAG: RNB domain-containing ribonuclease [Thiolinea sp.]